MSSTRYLQRLGHSWYVRVKVPANLQHIVGNTHLRKALHTRDLDEANRRKWPYVEAMKAEMDRMKGLDPLNLKAQEWRTEIRKAWSAGNEILTEALELAVTDEAEKIYEKTGNLKRAKEWVVLASAYTLTLDELVNLWLPHSDYMAATKKQHRASIEELKAFLGGDCLPSKVTDDVALDYVEDFIKKSGKAYETQRRKLNSLVAFWEWMGLRKHVPRNFNPWKGFRLSKQKTSKKTEDKRAYTDQELVQLFSHRPVHPGLSDVMVLGLYTGARLDEICSLKVSDIGENGNGVHFLKIRRSKTKAGVRTVAVAHPLPHSILSRRLKSGGDPEQQLFSEFKPGGYDQKLSWSVSKAFGRFRDGQGLSRATDFHSFRRTLITLMENLGMDQVKIARYVGHELPTIAYTVYSGGSTENTNIAVAKGIKYPKPVEDAVKNFLR